MSKFLIEAILNSKKNRSSEKLQNVAEENANQPFVYWLSW